MTVPQRASTARTIARACAELGIRSNARTVRRVVEPEELDDRAGWGNTRGSATVDEDA